MVAVGTVIGGRFRVDKLVGAGGMGVVVAATHLELGHRVAIKLLRDEVASAPAIVERFLREARAAVHLRTEHVCRVFDVGRTDTGAPYIVMELLDGNDLGRVVERQPLPVTIAVEYVMQACVALAEAHVTGIVHRDLKPANLLVTRRPGGGPLIKVLDFGIAKAMSEAGAQLTQTHAVLGSPAYMSPEQLQSARDVDPRTDIWSLGATLYQLLSARLPFYRPNVTEMAVRIVMEPPDPLEVDPALRAVVWRCLEKAPAQRYADVAALAADLAPFGGPSARAIAALVSSLVRGTSEPMAMAPVVSPHARTAAASVAGGTMGSLPGATRSVASPTGPVPASMVSVAAPVGPLASSMQSGAPGALAATAPRRAPRWWLAAPVAIVAVVAALVFARQGREAPPPAPVAVATPPAVAVIDAGAPVVVIDAAVAEAKPPVQVATETPPPKPKPPKTQTRRPAAPGAKVTESHAPRATPPAGPTAAPARSGTVAGTARELKDTCFESAADTPWNTAMCWCTKKDHARAKAAFAKLSGFKRTTVRQYCSVRGIDL